MTTKKKQYNLPTLTYQIMKTAFLTLLGTSAVMGMETLSDDPDVGLVIYSGSTTNTIGKVVGSATEYPELLDLDGNPLTTESRLNCVTHESSTTELQITDDRPLADTFRGNHVLECEIIGVGRLLADNTKKFHVETEGSCADRTFPLKDTASTVQANGKFDFQPLAPVDACSDGRLKSEAQPTQVKVTMKGDVKNKYDKYKTDPDMVHTYDLSNLAAHTFDIGIQNPRAAYLEVEGCQDDALCIGSASYEFLDSSNGRVHIASQNSSVGFTFDKPDGTDTDYKYTKPVISVRELDPSLEKGTHDSDVVLAIESDGSTTDLTLDESIDCSLSNDALKTGVSSLIPLTELSSQEDTDSIKVKCKDRMVAQVNIACPDKMIPDIGNFSYIPADNEFRSAPDGYDTNQDQDHAVSNDDVSTESTVVTVAKPGDRANLVLNDPTGDDVLSVADAGDNWLVTMSHGIPFGGDGSDVTKTITVSGSYFDGCNEVAAIPLSYNVAITFKSIPVWKAPVLQVASRLLGEPVRQRFMKWEITNDVDVDGAEFEAAHKNSYDTTAFWCADGNDDINSCHDGPRQNNELYLYFQGTTGCEGLPQDAIAERIQFTVAGADVFGTSALPCPPPRVEDIPVVMDETKLDWTVDFTVNNTDTLITLPTDHSMENHGIIAESAFLGQQNDCTTSGIITGPTISTCNLQVNNSPNKHDYLALNGLFGTCGSYLINHVKFEDVRRNDTSIDSSEVEFCNAKQLSVGILSKSATQTATFAAVQTGGVEADLKMVDFGWEACTGIDEGEYRQVMKMTYVQRGVHSNSPSNVEARDTDRFSLISQGAITPASGVNFQTSCEAICGNSEHELFGALETQITFTWQATTTNIESVNTFTMSTQLLDSPCSENVDADDDSLLTPFVLKVEKQEGGACAASLTGGDNIADPLRQNDVVCIEFVGDTSQHDSSIDRSLEIKEVLLVDNVLGEGQRYPLDSGDLTEGTNKGYDLHATKNITSDMVEKTFTLTVSYEESYEFGRRRLRSDYKLGNKLHDADASFTVLPSHITVQDSVEESAPDAAPDAAEDAADAAEGTAVTDADPSWIQVTTLALVAVLVLAVLYGMIKRANGDAIQRQQVISRVMGDKAYTPVGRFTSTIQY